uniref:Uncharacterized protein n=1 Tax=Clastoptera arizonana TaxID=38151 RepID=A0A1B6CLT9_9HEMI
MSSFAPQLGRTNAYGSVDPSDLASQLEYIKKDLCSFDIPASDISVEDSTRRCYDVLWRVPGFSVLDYTYVTAQPGSSACDLNHSTYTLLNKSPYTCYIRAQRPMGYRACPSSLAMWEPVSTKSGLMTRLKPGERLAFGHDHFSTNFVVPRLTTSDGRSAVHLLSVSIYREPVTDYGTTPILTGLHSIEFNIENRYRVNNGSIGTFTGTDAPFVIRSFIGDSHMNRVSYGPPTPTRIRDIITPDGFAQVAKFVSYTTKSGNLCQLKFYAYIGGKLVAQDETPTLDPGTIYKVLGSNNKNGQPIYIVFCHKEKKIPRINYQP